MEKDKSEQVFNTVTNSAIMQPVEHSNDADGVFETRPFWRTRRYLVVLMAFFGFFNVYALRVNLSVAIVAMTEVRNVIVTNATGTYTTTEQSFYWNSWEKGLVLSSFFYGYITTQLIGGYVANKIGGNLVFGLGIFMTAVFTLLTPLAANMGVYVLVAVRIIEGVFEGVTFPCIHAVWAKWAPPLERSRMASIAFAGNYAGTVVSMPLSGILASTLGWESIFYVFGTIGCIWFVAWAIIVKRSPEEDPYITEEEKNYIMTKLGNQKHNENVRPPWKAIFTSTAVWAIVASHFSENWGFYTLLTQLPTFLNDVLGFELTKTGFLSALPYLTMGILLGVSGYLADWSQVKGYLTTTQVRRYFNCSAFLGQTIFMLLAAFLVHPVTSMACITIAVGCGAFAWSGFAVNHLDIAPQYASILMGISNTWATIPGILSPLVTGILVQNGTKEEWKIVFYISAGSYLVGCVFYWIFVSGEVQPWAKQTSNDTTVQNKVPEKNGKAFAYSNEAIEMKDE
ncbi:CLUMA_CG019443, isoform A [Clunio marinus]|uniref:Sialin n=1 Tax=Clunio marinus TaxID=568069 RepID=A0A1J1J6W1_9DIPT|nr:CLUMA_CG019443, isoform A [Clunio marinus]